MQFPHVSLLAGVMLAAAPCEAQHTAYDPATGTVDIPCVRSFDSRNPAGAYGTHAVRLRQGATAQQFELAQRAPATYDTDCSGSYDTATGLYTDLINLGDTSYHLRMRRGANGVFTLEDLTPRGPATTSVWVARNGANTVYLAGTIHVMRPADYPLPRAYDQAYAAASALYFEIDMDDPYENGQGLTQAQLQQQYLDPQGLTLTQVLTPQNWSALRGYMLGEGLSIEAVNQWSTQMVINALGFREMDLYYGFSADGVDAYLAARAQRDGKAIHGLETSTLQHHVLHTMHEGYENELVQKFLDDVGTDSISTDMNTLVATWRSGDTTRINAESIEPMRTLANADYQLLHAGRNNAWVPQIDALLQTPETEMVVVGVAHMAGEEGLVRQLRRRGYSVERL